MNAKTSKLTTRDPWWRYARMLDSRSPFQTHGGLHGSPGAARTYGQLPLERRHGVNGAEHAEYVVYSYDTPIAWFVGGAWYQPDEKYSYTTSRHQEKIRSALCTWEIR